MRFLTLFGTVVVILSAGLAGAFGQDQMPFTDLSLPVQAAAADASRQAGSAEMPTEAAPRKPFSHFFAPLGVRGAQVIKPGK
jgi:nucleoside phosphorylase